jgi:SAM-dependent methyltransferase
MVSSSLSRIAVLPMAPVTQSPVPWLTSLYHKAYAGPYGDRRYPGNCSGELIKDLLTYFPAQRVLDPMTGSGTCADVCRELGIECVSFDLCEGRDACDPATYEYLGQFDFVWLHPPYWRQKQYTSDPRDMSNAPNLSHFLYRYRNLIANCRDVLAPGGRLAILMGDYADRDAGFCPLVFHTQRICFELNLRQHDTQIIRFSHGASSSHKTYQSCFIPGLHDVCTVVEKPNISMPFQVAFKTHGTSQSQRKVGVAKAA